MSGINQLLDDLEAKAQMATEGPWECHTELLRDDEGCVDGYAASIIAPMWDVINSSWDRESGLSDAEHIAANSPDVTLALVAALRAVLELHVPEVTTVTYEATRDTPEEEEAELDLCPQCGVEDCPTRRAITEALSGDDDE